MKVVEILELEGLVLTAADDSAAPDQWNFRFGDGCWLNLSCTWRIILDDQVVLAKGDHQQLFGRQEALDAARTASGMLEGRKILEATLTDVGDLQILFEGGARFETFTDSSGYESGTIHLNSGRTLVVLGDRRHVRAASCVANEPPNNEMHLTRSAGQHGRGPRS